MKKLVSNNLDNISKCRDLIDEGDLHKIWYRSYLFVKVAEDVKRQINKWLADDNYELDFLPQDLIELSDEVFQLIRNFQSKFVFKNIYINFTKYDIIDDKIILKETNKIAELMKIDRDLRECYKILSYMAIVYTLWLETKKNNTIESQMLQAIKQFL